MGAADRVVRPQPTRSRWLHHQHGRDRGDELPERFRSREGRRRALASARQRLEWQATEPEAETPAVEIEIDEQRVVAEGHGRKGGFRQFQRRGRSAVRSEWRFIAATHNLLKLHHHWITADIA